MYKVILPVKLDGNRYGMRFTKGVAHTSDERLVSLMREKGFTIETEPTGGNSSHDEELHVDTIETEPTGGRGRSRKS